MKEMMNKKILFAIKEKALMDGLNLTLNPLIATTIISYQKSPKFKPLIIKPYDGTKDPIKHVQTFKSSMIFHKKTYEMMCRSFPMAFRMEA